MSDKRATYADIEAAPEHLIAEIIDGQLVTQPRPAARHNAAATNLIMTLAGVDVVDYHEARCEHMMADFIEKHPELWNEDIGE